MFKQKRLKLFFLCIIIVILLQRGWYLWELKNYDPYFYRMPVYTDMFTFDKLAQQAVQNKGFGGVFEYSPFYLGFLVSIYWLFGHNLLLVKAIQLVIGIFSLILIAKIAKLLLDEKVALVSLLLGALYYPFLIYQGVLLSENLLIFFSLLMLFYLLRANINLSKKDLILAGISLGAAAVTKPSILTFLPFIFLAFFYQHEKLRAWRSSFLIGLAALIIILPCAISNYLASGKLVLIRSNGGITFYLGNNPQTDGSGYMYDAETHFTEFNKELKHKSFAERDRFYYQKAFAFIRENPVKFLKLTWNKFLLFWSAREIKNNIALAFYRRLAKSANLSLISFGFILPLAALGIFLSLRKAKSFFILYGFLFSQMATTVAYHVVDRFRQHLVGVLIIFAGFFLVFLYRKIKDKKTESLRIYLGSILIFELLFNFESMQKTIYPVVHPNGTYLYQKDTLFISDCRLNPAQINYWTFFGKTSDKALKKLNITVEPNKFKEVFLDLEAVIMPKTKLKLNINGRLLTLKNDSNQIQSGRTRLKIKKDWLRKGENFFILSSEPEKMFYLFIDEYFDYNRSAFFKEARWDFDDLGSWSYLGDGEYRIFLELKP